MIPLLLALALSAHPHPSGADAPPSLSQREREKTPEAAKGAGEREAVDSVAKRYGLAGEILVAKGDRVLLDKGYGTIDPKGAAPHRAGARWRLASITKQIVAVQVMQRLMGDRRSLDDPLVGQPAFQGLPLGTLSMRQLLTHHSGLANPDDTAPGVENVPSFYAATAPDHKYCISKPAVPGSKFAYNNCDYIVADSHIVVTGARLHSEWPQGVAMAKPGETGVPGFVGGKPEPRFQLAAWGAAGGLMGTARALFDFDRSLMTGKLLPPTTLAELWKPEGSGSYQALGQWVFPGRLKGCATPKRIVQRDGEIYGVQTRNYILPDDDLVVVVFTNRSSDDFPIGEIWQGKGFAYDLLSTVACP